MRKLIIILTLISLFLVFSFTWTEAEELERKLEVDYPEIGGVKPKTIGTDLFQYVRYIFNIAIIIVGLVLLVTIIWGGILYLVSSGQPVKIKEAKERISTGFLGTILLLASYLILTIINPQLLIFKGPDFKKIQPITKPPPEYKKEETSLIFVEIPLGRMLERISGINNIPLVTLEELEKFLTEREEKISDLNKRLVSLTDGCRCENTTPIATKPESFALGVACVGDPCKEREEINKILAINDKIIEHIAYPGDPEAAYKEERDSLEEFKIMLREHYEMFGNEEIEFSKVEEEMRKCLEQGEILFLKEYLARKEFYEEQGWKTKVVSIFPEQDSTAPTPSAPFEMSPGTEQTSSISNILASAKGVKLTEITPIATPTERVVLRNVKITSYFPGFTGESIKKLGVKELQGGYKDRRGKLLFTIEDFKQGKTKYVGAAMSQEFYFENYTYPPGESSPRPSRFPIFNYGDVFRIPELEKKFPGILFRAVDTGSILNDFINNNRAKLGNHPNCGKAVFDIPVCNPLQCKKEERNEKVITLEPVTIVKVGGIKDGEFVGINFSTNPVLPMGDFFTFYCLYGGTILDKLRKVPEGVDFPEAEERPLRDLPGEEDIEAKADPLHCPLVIPIGELIDKTLFKSGHSNQGINALADYIDELIKKLQEMRQFISECEIQGCEISSLCIPNPRFFTPPPAGDPSASPCLNGVAACSGDPCLQRNKIQETLEGIKLLEEDILRIIKELKGELIDDPNIIETSEEEIDLLSVIRVGAGFCFNENQDPQTDPTWSLLNCDLALGNKGPDGELIGSCHPHTFFCCTSDEKEAERAKKDVAVKPEIQQEIQQITEFYKPVTELTGTCNDRIIQQASSYNGIRYSQRPWDKGHCALGIKSFGPDEIKEREKEGYRLDCSGYVSRVYRDLGILPSKPWDKWCHTTWTFLRSPYFYMIPAKDIQKGDLIISQGITMSSRHAVIYISGDVNREFRVWHEGGGCPGSRVCETTRRKKEKGFQVYLRRKNDCHTFPLEE